MPLAPVVLSDAVNKVLSEVLPSEDPFDDPDFDPLVFVNERFPDEKALKGLEGYMEEVEAGIEGTQKELRETVRGQAGGSGHAERNLEEAKGSIQQLFKKVEEIRRMAEESESMVVEICTEISSLDNAKKNLTDAITVLKKMRDISLGLDELKASTDQEPADLATAAESIATCSQILQKYFTKHAALPRVKELTEKLSREIKLCSQLAIQELKQVDVDADEVSPVIIDACAVIEACGDEAITTAVTTFVRANIDSYKRTFPAGADESRLEKLERRFAWFRRLLKSYSDNLSGHVPAAWCIPQELGVEFCLATREDIRKQLEEVAGSMNIEILVRILQKTIDFEKDLTARMQQMEEGDDIYSYRGDDAGAVRGKWARKVGGQTAQTSKKYKYTGFITSCFEHTMDEYVSHESDRMNAAIRALMQDRQDLTEGQQTLPTALEIFSYIKQSLKKCSAFCKDEVLVKMHQAWSQNLAFYGSELLSQMHAASDEEMQRVCVIINSADWCVDTATKLADEVRAKIDEGCHSEVDEDTAADQFRTVINKGVVRLINALIKQLGGPLTEMTQTQWSTHEEVGDQSDYITSMCQILTTSFTDLGKSLKPPLFRYLCEKFVVVFVPRYVASLYNLRKPNPTACRQLLLDLQILKAQFPKIPNIGCPERFKDRELKAYLEIVRVNMGKGEAILKFLESEIPPTEGTLLADQYTELVQDASITDFVKLVEMKGVSTKDQKPLIEYLAKTKELPQFSKRDSSQHPEVTDNRTDTLRKWVGGGVSRIKDRLKEQN